MAQLVESMASKFHEIPGKFELTVQMTRIMFPFLLLVALAAQAMGADLAYVGSAFIATREANAAQGYKDSEGAYAPLTIKMTRAEVAEEITLDHPFEEAVEGERFRPCARRAAWSVSRPGR